MNPTTHTCDCGYTWLHGQDGSHNCSGYYRKTIADLHAALAAKTEGAKLDDRKIADTVNELRKIAIESHAAGYLRERIAYLIVPLLKAAPAVVVEPAPVAWVRRHPDGVLTSELLIDAVIEPVRKNSGAWLPLGRIVPAMEGEALVLDAARYRWLRVRTVAWNALRQPEWKTGVSLDSAIDAAMKSGGKNVSDA